MNTELKSFEEIKQLTDYGMEYWSARDLQQPLGKITESEGFVESEKARLRRQQIHIERVQVKEYGITSANRQFLLFN